MPAGPETAPYELEIKNWDNLMVYDLVSAIASHRFSLQGELIYLRVTKKEQLYNHIA